MALFGNTRSQQSRERTAEERERDREERERRRAARAREQEFLNPSGVPVEPQPPAEEREPPVEEQEPPVEEQEPPVEEQELELPAAVGEPPAAEEQKPLAVETWLPDEEPPAEAVDELPEEQAEEEVYEEDEEAAAAAAGEPVPSAPIGVKLPPRARSAGVAQPPASPRRLTRARLTALISLVLAAALVWLLLSLFQPFAGSGHGSVIVNIPKGSSSSKIGSILADDGVVSSGWLFDLRALIEGKRGGLHSGRFQLEHGMSYGAAIDALSKPPPRVIAVKVVIPEGQTRRQIAALAVADSLTGSYLDASRQSSLLSLKRYGAPAATPNLEGFLFPATYELRAGMPAAELVKQQLLAFMRNFGGAETAHARALHITPYQLLIVASMIEREAAVAGDRAKIAAVIYNRLRLNMPLGIDATIRYALTDYTSPLTKSQLKLDSPYNTRTRRGLPPTPIGNPGVASITAAGRPAKVPYIYYVAGADGCGEHVFSTDYAAFQRNVAAYQAALAHNGGRVPSCKRK